MNETLRTALKKLRLSGLAGRDKVLARYPGLRCPKGGKKKPRRCCTSGAGAFGAPSAWLFLAGLRPRKARRRFTRRRDCNHGRPGPPNWKTSFGADAMTCQEYRQ
jgi:hypothetical protein